MMGVVETNFYAETVLFLQKTSIEIFFWFRLCTDHLCFSNFISKKKDFHF